MPALSEMLQSNLDLSGYEPVDKPSPPGGGSLQNNLEPGTSIFLRTPIPPVWQTTSDSLRTFFNGGVVPQHRVMAPGNRQLGS
jgi:hypothetical protein